MSHLKVVPLRSRDKTERKLVKSVGKLIARQGFQRLGINAVAREAGVDKKLIYRYFGGLEGLVARYGQSIEFWPSAAELLGDDEEAVRTMSPAQLMTEFFVRYLRAILARPETLDILAWEAVERNGLTEALEQTRVRSALEFFELMQADPPEEVDLSALVLVMAGAVNFLAVRSRVHTSLGGVDLTSEEGWQRVEKTLGLILERTLSAR